MSVVYYVLAVATAWGLVPTLIVWECDLPTATSIGTQNRVKPSCEHSPAVYGKPRINFAAASPQLANYLRQSGIQSPYRTNSPSTSFGYRYSNEPNFINRHNDAPTFIPNSPAHSQYDAQSKSIPEKPSTPQPTRIIGDMTLTPTHSTYIQPQNLGSNQNPHSLIVSQTPIISGPNQAKNSIKLQNCVSTVNLGCELKLLDIYCKTRFSEYNPSRFHGVVMRILEPRATALVFRSGKVVCTGAKNEHDSLLATRKFSRIIKKLGFPVTFRDFKIQNLVATADLRFPIKLETLQQAHGQFTSYEPELFPGLIYRMIRPRIVLLIFVNGKIVFTGAKSRDDIVESLNIIYPILRSFKKN